MKGTERVNNPRILSNNSGRNLKDRKKLLPYCEKCDVRTDNGRLCRSCKKN